MDLIKMNEHLNRLEDFNSKLAYENGDGWLKRRITTIIRDLKDNIDVKKELDSQGDEIQIPNYHNDDMYHTIKKEGVIYKIHKFVLDKDNSFNLDTYAYIPYNEGFIELGVNLLGKDNYGDRIFTYARYFKTRSTKFHYYDKSYGKNHRFPDKYKEHVKFLIDEFNKLPEVDWNFNPLKVK